MMINAIEVDGISKAYGSRPVLDNISFNVKKGNIHGFLGPNGAGKTTTMRIISRLLSPSSGEVRIFGHPNTELDMGFHNKLGFLLENPPLYNELKVHEYLKFVAQLKQVPTDKISQRVAYCEEVLGLGEVKNRFIENLSKGFKQRVGIAQAIINLPDIVILDEPTVGLDPQAVIETRNLIVKLKEEHTILLSSHQLHELGLICDEVTIISKGHILDSGKIGDLRNRIETAREIQIDLVEFNPKFEDFLSQSELVNLYKKRDSIGQTSYLITPSGYDELRPLFLEKAISCGAKVLKLDMKEHTLEDIFISITSEHD